MAVSQRLDLRQSQSLVMTPQLQQAIRLLQLSNLELIDYVEQELEQNPLLERDESEDGAGPAEAGQDEAPQDDIGAGDGAETEGGDSLDQVQAESLPSDGDAPLDSGDGTPSDDYEPSDGWAESADSQRLPEGRSGDFGESEGGLLVQQLSEEASLREHLLRQVQLELSDPVDRMIAAHLVETLDEAGYLGEGVEEIAARLDCPTERIEATLAQVQGFDPPGVFARDLKECLALQLADLDRLDPAMAALLEHLDLVARRDLERLKSLCGVDDEDLVEMLAELRALDPKPALAFESLLAEPIIPDVIVRQARDGGWTVELNSETLPRVLINQTYHARLRKSARRRQDREYLSEQLQSASWLVKALHQRATTILKVSTEIVRRQDGFLRRGVQHLKPLTLRDVAETIEMHESTVSRVTSNKYVTTPRGTFELKYFFTAAIAGVNGEAHSAEAVRHRIRLLIDAETPEAILSDDSIVASLRGDGIDIARRTVAKYREAMRIPSSVERRRAAKVAARA